MNRAYILEYDLVTNELFVGIRGETYIVGEKYKIKDRQNKLEVIKRFEPYLSAGALFKRAKKREQNEN